MPLGGNNHQRAGKHIVVAGGGIAGLASALALAQTGFGVTVLERATEAQEAGAGLQLGPNAVKALQHLQVADDVQRRASVPEGIVLRRGIDGKTLAHMSLGGAAVSRYGAPYWVVHRADLRAALEAQVRSDPRIDLRYGAEYANVMFNREQDLVIQLKDGSTLEARGLIGADGVWSRVRSDVVPNVSISYSGFVAYRAVMPTEIGQRLGPTNTVSAWLRPDAHLVSYPVRGGSAVNAVIIVESRWTGENWSAPADQSEVHGALQRFSPALPQLLDDVTWLKWALAAPVKLPHWSNGNVVLLGDAAHAMLPFLAQGAAMALEDAVFLGAKVRATPDDLPLAFRNFGAERWQRAARVQDRSTRNGAMFHWDGPRAFARDAILKVTPERRLLSRMDWLYGHSV